MERLIKIITPKRLSYFLGIVFLGTLIPLVVLGFYNHPGADDYSIGCAAYRTFQDTGNPIAALGSAIGHAYSDWMNWMGYFTSTFLMAFPPSVFGEFAYKFSTIILLGAFCSSVWYLFRMIFVKAIGADKYNTNSVVFVTLIGIIQCMPIDAVKESFFWYCGAANYILISSLSMWEIGLLISLYTDVKRDGKKHWFKKIITIVFAFLIGGGNHLTALNAVLLTVLMWIVFLIGKQLNRKEVHAMIPPSLGLLVGFLLNVLAPGNATRVAITEGLSPVKAVLISLFYYFKLCMNEWLTWPIIIMLVFLVPLFLRVLRKTDFQFRYPLVVVFVGYGLTSAMMTPSLFALNNLDAGRLQALVYIMFILTLVLSEAYVIGWVVKRFSFTHNKAEDSKDNYGKNELMMILFVLLFTLLASGLTLIPEPDYFISTEAAIEVVSGDAGQYSAELDRRYEMYISGDKDIVVEPLSVYPKLIYFSDMVGENEEWISRAICRYYDLTSLKIKEK